MFPLLTAISYVSDWTDHVWTEVWLDDVRVRPVPFTFRPSVFVS